MVMSTFGVKVVSTSKPGKYLAKARNFEINYAANANNEGITPEEGLSAALGSCETIVTSSTFDKNKKPYNSFYLKEKLEQSKFHVNFHLNDSSFFSEIKKDIENTSPVYDNMVHAIPIEVSDQSEK